GGTSDAAPQWAGLAAELVQQSGGALGNPGALLYGRCGTAALHDITSGSNGDYSAGVGYDLVTGLGSFDARNLLAAVGPTSTTTTTVPPTTTTSTTAPPVTTTTTTAPSTTTSTASTTTTTTPPPTPTSTTAPSTTTSTTSTRTTSTSSTTTTTLAACFPSGASCTANADCCSQSCRKRGHRKACR